MDLSIEVFFFYCYGFVVLVFIGIIRLIYVIVKIVCPSSSTSSMSRLNSLLQSIEDKSEGIGNKLDKIATSMERLINDKKWKNKTK